MRERAWRLVGLSPGSSGNAGMSVPVSTIPAMGLVTIVDATTSGKRGDTWMLDVAEERLALSEVIRRRVFQEVADYNARHPAVFRSLVQSAGAELTPNGYTLRESRHVDAEAQYLLALKAFGGNGFVVLVGDRQVEDLHAEVDLPAGAEVTFLKLVPLVGG
jgi:hypothetical protein